jgi:hypothetical protein
METIVRNVRDLDQSDRSALERIMGRHLGETQQVILQVASLETAGESGTREVELGGVPSWWKIYEGLSDDEVDRLDSAVRQRANLTRSFE